jgi:hypothetical protein
MRLFFTDSHSAVAILHGDLAPLILEHRQGKHGYPISMFEGLNAATTSEEGMKENSKRRGEQATRGMPFVHQTPPEVSPHEWARLEPRVSVE